MAGHPAPHHLDVQSPCRPIPERTDHAQPPVPGRTPSPTPDAQASPIPEAMNPTLLTFLAPTALFTLFFIIDIIRQS